MSEKQSRWPYKEEEDHPPPARDKLDRSEVDETDTTGLEEAEADEQDTLDVAGESTQMKGVK